MTVLLGNIDQGANTANSAAVNIGTATRLLCIESGVIETLWVSCGPTIPGAANTHWAIYEDGVTVPGARLTANMTGTAGTANTYSSFPVSPGFPVVKGLFYWPAFKSTSGAFNKTNFAASGGDQSEQTSVGSLPDPWGAETFGNAVIVNMRAEGTPLRPNYDAYPKPKLRTLAPPSL